MLFTQVLNQKYLNLKKVYQHATTPSYPAEKSEKALDFFRDWHQLLASARNQKIKNHEQPYSFTPRE